jgi:hypothetical protein
LIIGLCGYAQSGKDTVAQVLVDNYGFTRVAFADKIREFLYEVNPMVGCSPSGYLKDLVDLEGWEKAKQQPQVRRLLQDLGVGARKVFSENFWVQQALKDVHFEGNYVITDVRFTNEADIIKKYDNAQLWRVKRLGVEAVNSHVSEHELDGYPVDHFVKNDGDVKDLWEEVLMLCHHMGLDDV